MAKAFAAQAYRAATVNAVQLHGGIGYMQEYDLQFYYRRARAEEVLLGTTEDHLERVAAALGALTPRVEFSRRRTIATSHERLFLSLSLSPL